MSSCAWSWVWQSLAELLEPNWLGREGSGAGSCFRSLPAHGTRSRSFCSGKLMEFLCVWGSSLCWLCSAELKRGDEDAEMCLGFSFAVYLRFLGGTRISRLWELLLAPLQPTRAAGTLGHVAISFMSRAPAWRSLSRRTLLTSCVVPNQRIPQLSCPGVPCSPSSGSVVSGLCCSRGPRGGSPRTGTPLWQQLLVMRVFLRSLWGRPLSSGHAGGSL